MNAKLYYLVLLILILSGSLFAQGVEANLIHSWTFDDGTPNDIVGGANGILMGGAVIEDGALLTAEQDQYLELPAEFVALNELTEFSCEIWFESIAGANTSWSMFFYFGGSQDGLGYNGFFMTAARGDNVSRAAISCWITPPYSGESAANGPEYDDGNLHHMIATLNSTEINLFIDGAQAITPNNTAQGPTALSDLNTIDSLEPLLCFLAKGGYDADPEWLGRIYECNIYNRALTPDEIFNLSTQDPTVGVARNQATTLPKECGLMQNYPNPFNPGTTISFNLQKKSKVNITVYDMLGHQVTELLNEIRDAGQFSVQFDGSNISSGLYLCKMQIDGQQILTKKMMLLK